MKRILLVLSAFAALFAQAKTVTLTVDSNTTLSAALTAADTTLESGDTLVKNGLGKLTSDQVFADDFKLTVTVSEGVLEITAPGQLGFTNQITVENGATLLVYVPETGDPVMLKSRTIKLSGTGAEGYKGAIVLAGKKSYQVFNYITFNLQSDAAIAATATGQWGPFSNATFNMNNHVLTLVGDVESGTPEFRFRYKATINNAAGFALRNVSLTSTPKSTAEHVCNPKVPYLMMDAKSTFTSGTADGMFLGCFATYIAEYGATITIPNWGLGVTGVGGSPMVGTGASAVLQVNGTYTAHADDLLAGHCFSSSAAGLKFGNTSSSSVVFEVDDWSKLVGGSTVYTAASAADGKGIAYAGTLSITNENPYAAHWSLDKTSDTDKLLLKWSANKPEGVVSVTDWGLEPGEANMSGNAAKFNAGVANLAEGSTLWFPVGDWYFDAPVTMPDEDKVTIELEAGLAKLHYSNGGVSVTTDPVVDPTNVIIRVEYGATATVDEAIAAASFDTWPTGASLEKRGSGTLIASDTIRDLVGFFHIYEGVMQASKNGDLGKDEDSVNRIYVHDGASLLLTPEASDTRIINKRTVQLEGSGYQGLKIPGALTFDTKDSYQVIYNSSIALEDDAVISSTGTAGQNGLFSYATLNMKSHTLTLTCDADKQANFRFRYGRSILNAGTIVLDRAKLSTTDHDITISPANTLKVVLKRGGTLAPYRTSFFDGVASIECIAASTGTSGRINADNPNIAVTLKDVSGPLTIDSKVTATITGTLGAKASDISDGKVLTSVNALTFASGSVFALDQDVELPTTIENEPAVYMVASSTAGITGRPRSQGLTIGDRRYMTAVKDDNKGIEIKPASGMMIIVW